MIIRLADCPPQPWKNGLGRTREIAVHPDGASGDEFHWRVSVAEVDSAAPFSRFPGIDRHIVLLEGDGFRMLLDGKHPHDLTAPWVPFAFAGEASVDVTLVSGATRDFNLMLRRSEVSGGVQVCTQAGPRELNEAAVLVFAARGEIDTPEGKLQSGDSWQPSGTSAGAIVLAEGAVALAIHVTPRSL